MSLVQKLADITATEYAQYNAVEGSLVIAALTLLIYQHVLTVDEEVAQISRKSFTTSTAIYFANRYLPLAVVIYANCPLPDTSKPCLRVDKFLKLLEGLQYIVWAAFSSLRTYALQRKLSWAIVIFICGSMPMVGLMAVLKWAQVYSLPTLGCTMIEMPPPWLQFSGYLLSRGPLVFADIAVIVITWKKLYKSHAHGAIIHMIGRRSLITVFMHHGITYFVVLTALNIPQMIAGGLATISSGPLLYVSLMVDLMEPAVWFLFPHARLTAILVASFLADLRKAAEGRTYQESLASMGSLEFRVIGSFAASLTSISGAHLEEGEITDQGDSTSEGEGGNREGRAEAEVEVEAEAEAEAVAGPSGWSAV